MDFVGQVANLRGGWLPPPVRCERGGTLWVGPIDNRPQLTKLPHKVSTRLYHSNTSAGVVEAGKHPCTDEGGPHMPIHWKNSLCALPPRMRARSASGTNASNSSKRAACFRYSAGALPSVPQIMRSGPKVP
jgi:hypothetical protein